jgi:bifunctional DNase/RNase
MVEMRVAGIALDAASRSPIVLLRDPGSRRQVPIWIDQAQAQNILAGLGEEKPPRPLSHDLMVALLAAGDLKLERVIIHAIEESTFRAVLKLTRGEGKPDVELDARPSDAIAVAVRTGSSIWMLEEVVADASMPVDAEADAEDAGKLFGQIAGSYMGAKLQAFDGPVGGKKTARARQCVGREIGAPFQFAGDTLGEAIKSLPILVAIDLIGFASTPAGERQTDDHEDAHG